MKPTRVMAADNHDDVSKSQRKRESRALQELAARLVQTDPAWVSRLPIDPELGEAIELARRLERQRGARKRQIQYIGKLLRRRDAAPLQQALARTELQDRRDARIHRRIEAWRERLIEEGEPAVQALLEELPDIDRHALERLVRAARQERAGDASRSPAYRQLFRYLRQQIGSHEPSSG